MFVRLLNSLLQRFKRRSIEKREPLAPTRSNSGAPDHWLRMQRHVPPEHWLKVAKDAGPVVVTNVDESATAPSTTWPANVEEHNAVRSSPDWTEISRHAASRPNAEFSETELTSRPSSNAFCPNHRTASQTEIHWPPKNTAKTESAITRFLRRLSAKSQAVEPHPTFGKLASLETKAPGRNFPEVSKTHRGKQSPEWQTTVTNTVPESATFPVHDRNHATPSSFRESHSQSRLTHIEPWFPEAHWSVASPGREGVFRQHQNSDAVMNPRLNFPGRRENSERQPASWPELPSSMHDTNMSFSDDRLRQVAETTNFADVGPANCWPELGADRSSKEQNWRSLMRIVQRSQRRDREQRGY